jgi:hypothetical protein
MAPMLDGLAAASTHCGNLKREWVDLLRSEVPAIVSQSL